MDERLYGLLPAVYRERDAARGGALRALLAVLESELVAAEETLDAQYENWFVETCGPDLLTRIGDLVGVDARIAAAAAAAGGRRALVANTIRRRRRKGVAGALEEAARDATGWQTRVVEYFQLLGMTQHSRHPRDGRGGTVDVRDRTALAAQGGAFATLAVRPDVRRIASGRGRHNVPNLGLFVWRGEIFTVGPATVMPVPGRPGCFTFHPLGIDLPLAASPYGSVTRETLAQSIGRDVTVTADGRALTAQEIEAADLGGWAAARHGRVALDPERGRLAFPEPPTRCEVRYSYRAAGRLGGGPYDRRGQLAEDGGAPVTGAEAVSAAVSGAHGPADVVTIGDDTVLDGDVTVSLDPGTRLVIQAADGARPTLRGELRVRAPGGAALVVDGLLVGGQLIVYGAVHLTLRHCTAPAGVTAGAGDEHLVVLDHAVVGPLTLPPGAGLSAADSILDTVVAGDAELARVTAIGAVRVDRLNAADSIFAGDVDTRERQSGSVRYCYVPPGSHTPPRSGCQPDLALGVPGAGAPDDVVRRVRPRFRAVTYGAPGYADLTATCPAELLTGAESGTEMGAYAGRRRPQRDAALWATLEEYLPYGLEAGVIDVP